MKPSVYLETSFVSHLVGRFASDIVIASHQRLAREWWNFRRNDFELYISEFVVDEIGKGHAALAAQRLEVVRNIQRINADEMTKSLGNRLVREIPLPPVANVDAYHIAIAAVNRIDYLLTWNCTHIANASIQGQIRKICAEEGLKAPVICIPPELMKGGTNDETN
jgi:hypothetical protein